MNEVAIFQILLLVIGVLLFAGLVEGLRDREKTALLYLKAGFAVGMVTAAYLVGSLLLIILKSG